jgi:predicted nucleic-acid-binding protein
VIAIDTNVLVRVLVDDPAAMGQCRQARDLVESADGLWISEIVLVETVWVLQSAYGFSRLQVLSVLERISTHPSVKVQSADLLATAITLFARHSADFSDCLILAHALSRRETLHTFDKKLGNIPGAALLTSDQVP